MRTRSVFKALIGLLMVQVVAFGQTVSNIHFDGVGDSSMRVLFDVTGSFNAFRIRYGTADTASGTGGFLQRNGTVPSTFSRFDMAGNISGLAPNTTYYVSPEVSNNGGASWSSGVSATVKTLVRTQTLPIAPVPVNTAFPNQTGAVRNVAGNCSNLQAQMNAAQPGDTIVVPAGAVCTGPYTMPTPQNVKTFSPANVRTGDSTVTINNHGFTENQEVRLSAYNGGCLPGMMLIAYGLNCDYGGDGWRKGGRYWVHVPDASHIQILDGPAGNPVVPGWLQFTCSVGTDTITFKPTWQTPGGISYPGFSAVPANTVVQLHSTGAPCGGLALNTNYYLLTACPASTQVACGTKVSLTPGGPPVDITSTGTGVHKFVDQGLGTMAIGPAPDANGKWIVLTSGGALPSVNTRTTPSFDAQGFHIRQTITRTRAAVFSGDLLAHNWRIVGAIFDTGTNNDYLTTTDPRPYCGIMTIGQDNENILFDRTRVQGAGYPNRFGCPTAIFINGRNVGVIDSDWRGMDYWHPWYNGFTGGFTSTSVSIAAGNAYAGSSIFTRSASGNTVVTVTGGGSISGTVYVYFAMDGTLRVLPPAGVTMTCANPTIACTVLPGVLVPGWPTNADGRMAGLKLATFTLNSGAVTGVCAGGCIDPSASADSGEGTSAILSGIGPGPYIFDNNFISGTGIPLHFDDSAGPFQVRSDYTITRNVFDTPASQMAGGPLSNGLRYGHRQALEWKGGRRIKVDGNTFQGSFSEVSPACVSVAVTPRSGGYVTDFDFTNNTVTGCGGINLPSPVDSIYPVSKPSQRIRAANNLFLLNGPAYSVAGLGSPRGWVFEAGYGSEDILIDHNTAYDPRGSTPAFLYWMQHGAGGLKITNNIFFYTGNTQAIRAENVSPNCGNTADKVLMDCAFTNGPGVPGYTFLNNVIVPSWADSTAPSSFILPSVVTNAFPTPPLNYVPAGLGAIKFVNANYSGNLNWMDLHLAPDSPYIKSSTDGKPAGANVDELQSAQTQAAANDQIVVTSASPSTPISPAPVIASIGPPGSYQMRFASNLAVDDGSVASINVTNSGSTYNSVQGNGNICANFYTFSPDEQMVSCCSCLVTPNALMSLSVKRDLVANTITPVLPGSAVVALIAARNDGSSGCNAAAVTVDQLTDGLEAWGTSLTPLPITLGSPRGSYGVTETPFGRAMLGSQQFTRLTQICAFLRANGSGYGVCKTCRVGGLGGNSK